jgi:hypothetical protein
MLSAASSSSGDVLDDAIAEMQRREWHPRLSADAVGGGTVLSLRWRVDGTNYSKRVTVLAPGGVERARLARAARRFLSTRTP